MRDFFIQALDKVVALIVILGAVAVLLGAIGVAFFVPDGGLLQGLGVLVAGSLYLIIVGGSLYLALGIYANTKRTADLLERQVGGSAPKV